MTHPHILPPKPFYLLRHGQSEANVRRVAAGGNLDSPLTELGKNQARELAAVVHHLPQLPSKIYHSPQIRAKDTAYFVNNTLQLETVEIHDLKEHIFGDWENTPWDDIKHLVDNRVNPPNGETYTQFGERVQRAITDILNTDHPAPPLLVAHGGVFHAIGRLYGEKIGEVSNCVLHYFSPAPHKEDFPWSIDTYTPCPTAGLKKSPLF
jgi:broad specificity phosphatase PhoE